MARALWYFEIGTAFPELTFANERIAGYKHRRLYGRVRAAIFGLLFALTISSPAVAGGYQYNGQGYQYTGPTTYGAGGTITPTGGSIFSGPPPQIVPAKPYTPSGGYQYNGPTTYGTGGTITPTGGSIFSGPPPQIVPANPYTPSGGYQYNGPAHYATGGGISPTGGNTFSSPSGTGANTTNIHAVVAPQATRTTNYVNAAPSKPASSSAGTITWQQKNAAPSLATFSPARINFAPAAPMSQSTPAVAPGTVSSLSEPKPPIKSNSGVTPVTLSRPAPATTTTPLPGTLPTLQAIASGLSARPFVTSSTAQSTPAFAPTPQLPSGNQGNTTSTAPTLNTASADSVAVSRQWSPVAISIPRQVSTFSAATSVSTPASVNTGQPRSDGNASTWSPTQRVSNAFASAYAWFFPGAKDAGASATSSGNAKVPTTQTASFQNTSASAGGLTRDDQKWIGALPQNLQQPLLNLTPAQVAKAKATGQWSVIQSRAQAAAGAEDNAQTAFIRDLPVELVKETWKQSPPGQVAQGVSDIKSGHPAQGVAEIGLGAASVIPFGEEADAAAMLARSTDAGSVAATAARDAANASGGALKTIPMSRLYAGENIVGNDAWKGGGAVKYFTNAERASYAVTFKDGKLYHAAGNPLDGQYIFVMDKDGNIFATNEQSVGSIHHSSIAAGQPVAGAGEITVNNGQLQTISDASGHYRPPRSITQQVLDVLDRNGIDTSSVTKDFTSSR